MRKKILVLGSAGMLGKDLMQALKNHIPIGLAKDGLDITDEQAVTKKISEISPDIVINAAAYTDVDGCENKKELCIEVNGKALAYIAKACKRSGAALIHISTDYVFDGRKEDGYDEDDLPNPINEYGKSKLLGETNIQTNTSNYIIIRTSWLFGKNGKNFVHTIQSLSQSKNSIDVVDDQIGSPTCTKDLAEEIARLIEKMPQSGIYHITSKGSCSWHAFAQEIIRLSAKKTRIIPTTSESFVRPARRPACSILKNTKLITHMPHWKQALRDFLQQ